MLGARTACAVVINDEGHHAIWPAAEQVPDGWQTVGVEGTEERCLDYIEVAWNDLRPRSLREASASPRYTGSVTSSLERDLVLGANLSENPGTDLLGGLIHVERALDPEVLALAWHDVADRHPMLRTRYALRHAAGTERVVAITDEHATDPTWTTHRWEERSGDGMPDGLKEAALAVHRRTPEFGRQAGLVHGFDCGTAGTGIVVSHLHAVLDGRSMVRVVQDLLDAYQQREQTGSVPHWQEPAANYQDYRQHAARQWAMTDRAYWRTHAVRDGDSPRLTQTAFGDVASAVTRSYELSDDITAAARAAVDECSLPLSTFAYVSWARLLARRSGGHSATFATTLSQRFGFGGQETLVGNAAVTMPLTVLLDAPIAEVLRETRQTVLNHREHAWGSWPELLTWAGTPGATVESLVVLDRATLQERLRAACPQWPGISAQTLRHSAFGVVLHVYTAPGLSCELTVDGQISAEEADGLLAEFEAELTKVISEARAEHQAQGPEQGHALDGLPEHESPYGIPYAPGWSLWPTAVLRSAAVEFSQLEPLGDPALAQSADDALGADPASHERFLAEFDAAGHRLNVALHKVARDPRITEALAWQNRSALSNGIGPLLRRDPATVRRNAQHRQHEAMLTSYLQRYAAKNDTIGFFGPVGWARVEPGEGITMRPGQWPVDRRSVHFEGWVIRAIADRYATELRPWLTPRLVPYVRLTDDGTALRVPLADPIALSPLQQEVFGRVDGSHCAAQIANAVCEVDSSATPNAVYQVLDEAHSARRVRWEFDLPHQDARPLDVLRRRLENLGISADTPQARQARTVRERALRDLDDLAHARRRLSDAAGNSDAVAEAMADLEALVQTLTGEVAGRRQGELYAGRTPAYEECRLGAEVTVGTEELARVAEPMEAVLNASRWFAHACSEAFHSLLQQLHAQRARALGSSWVPLSDVWLLAVDYLITPEDSLLSGPSADLQQRWDRVLDLPAGWADSDAEIRLDVSEVLRRSRTQFAVPRAGWRLPAEHSPDLMYLPGKGTEPPRWVLGEVHPGQNTMAYRTWVDLLDDPDELRVAAAASNGTGRVWLTPVDERDSKPTRLTYALASPHDLWLSVSESATGTPRSRTIRGADALVGPGPDGLRVRHGEHDLPAMEVLADVVSGSVIQHFDVIGKRDGVTPRVSLGDLVLSRKTWRFPCIDQAWVKARSEAERYLAVRRWLDEHSVPRYVFMRTTGEKKPVFLDLTGLASIDLLARAVRRSIRESDSATLTLTEMLPGPDDLWLTGPEGHGRTAEFRLVAVDASATSVPRSAK